MVPEGARELRQRKEKGSSLFSKPAEALGCWGWAARPAGSTCLTCSAHCPLRPGTAARSWAHCQELPGPLQRCALTCPLSLPPLLLCPGKQAGPRTPPMSHLEADPKAGRERTEQRGRREREENPQCSHLSPPVQLVTGCYGEAGWGWSSAWPWSRLNLRSSLSLSLFGESSSFTFRMWVDSIYSKHCNPQDLELSMGGKAEAAASRSTKPLLAMPGSSPRLCSEHTRPTYPSAPSLQ